MLHADALIELHKTASYEHFRNYDRYKFKLGHISRHLAPGVSVLDIGCAKGELLYFLNELQPAARYTGLDLSASLLEQARNEPKLRGVTFVQGNAVEFDLKTSFDLVLMSGLLSVCDDLEKLMDTFFKHLKKGGHGYIFSMFNPFDVDVLVQFRNNSIGDTSWKRGFNNFSMKTVESYVRKHTDDFSWLPFQLSIDLEPSANPVDSITLNTKERGRIVTNGLGIIVDFYLLHVVK